ncbi:DUF4974 domain-containing protein [Fulvivirgaceae bacterium BMA12]|uniref:DUF4974 domain-containing protein n=1 Tax=Agaribacillus aureus TaxID=3051825 RepID=A0ABT8LHS3_9BACT|nr:DUF4974 domain-containing protein [Fulvivirgaceae bacterium BMA12]
MNPKVPLSQLYQKFLAGTATREEFSAYLSQVKDPATADKILELIAREWDGQFRKKNIKRLSASEIDKAYEHIVSHPRRSSPLPFITTPKKKRVRPYLVAASVVLVMIAALSIYWFNGDHVGEPAAVSSLEKRTIPGQQATITLSDGSMVMLNAASKLVYPAQFKGRTREVTLEGEGFFEVIPAAKQPFVVRSGNLITTASGTAFNVKAYPEDGMAEVAVQKGQVSVARINDRTSKPTIVTANMLYRINNKVANLKPVTFTDQVAWRDRTLLFKVTPFSEVAKTLSRWYGTKIILDNEAIGNCKITGQFRYESLENVLKMLEHAVNITYEITEGGVRVNGEGCVGE